MSRIAIAFCLGVAAGPAAAQDPANGQALFLAHCAYCHGETGVGDGPRAAVLNPQPKDLTRLALENGGSFPTLAVVMRIDGREAILAHGSPMPTFGEFFEGKGGALKTEAGQPILTSESIADVVTWLQTIQVAE